MRSVLLAELEWVPHVRHTLRDQLTDWGLEHLADTLVLAVNELLANAVLHGSPAGCRETITMTVLQTARELRVAVEDSSSRQPRLRQSSSDAESGRGLALVNALCDRWGVAQAAQGAGKQVWLEMDLPEKPVTATPG